MTVIGGIFCLAFLGLTMYTVSALQKKKWQNAGTAVLGAIVCFFITNWAFSQGTPSQTVASTAAAPTTNADANSPTDAPVDAATDTPTDPPTAKPQRTPKPRPTATPESYEHQVDREKHEYYEQVDQTVSAEKIAGNPSKYVGTYVDLHCTVSNVPQQGYINASCGDDDTNIVIEYDDTGSLDQGQKIRVLGEVGEPEEGTNAMGGSMNFPTVKAKYME